LNAFMLSALSESDGFLINIAKTVRMN